MTLQQLGDWCGVSRAYLSAVELEHRPASQALLVSACAVLGLDTAAMIIRQDLERLATGWPEGVSVEKLEGVLSEVNEWGVDA